jgi:hypothetical protein
VPGLVHSALFNVDQNEEMDPSLVETVTERLLIALDRHLEEENSKFEKWFLGPKSSLVHQLSKQKRSPGGELDEGEVAKVLLHQGWQAYQYASNCIHAQMRIFQNALPTPLTDIERVRFEHAFLPQPYLGNLPLVLLAPRVGFVQGLISDIWEQLPDLSLVPVLHRLLDYYATMAVRRREADRTIKRRRSVPFVEAAYVPRQRTQRLQELAAEVRELDRIDCGCPRRDWWAELTGRTKKEIRIKHHCSACYFKVESVLPHARVAEIGRNLD